VPNKSLGQHWLKDRQILQCIADSVTISENDTVLEVGPGLGTLTSVLLARAKEVIAVEFDADLAAKLPKQFPGKCLEVVHADILQYDLAGLPGEYIVVANVPYYITSKILDRFLRAGNQPSALVLLVQQEVAEKYAARSGQLSASAVFLQAVYDVQLGIRVPKMHFTPPPKVDSQVLICKKHHVPKIAEKDLVRFRQLVNAGFSSPRKKLRSTLAAGLQLEKSQVETLLTNAQIGVDLRAQDLSVEDWQRLL